MVLKLSSIDHEAVRRYAFDYNLSMAEVIRRAIAAYLKKGRGHEKAKASSPPSHLG